MQQACNSLVEDFGAKQAELRSLSQHFRDCDATLQRMQDNIDSLNESIDQHKRQIRQASNDNMVLQRKIQVLDEEINRKNNDVLLLTGQVESMKTAHEELVHSKTKSMEELDKVNQVLKNSNQSLEKANQDMKERLEQERCLRDNEMQLLQSKEKEERRRLEKENQALKKEMHALRTSGTQKGYGDKGNTSGVVIDYAENDDPSNDLNYDSNDDEGDNASDTNVGVGELEKALRPF